jgi:hypothetical protein
MYSEYSGCDVLQLNLNLYMHDHCSALSIAFDHALGMNSVHFFASTVTQMDCD